MLGIEKRFVFLFSAPQVSAWGPCFRSVGLFPPGWNGGFHLWRYSRGGGCLSLSLSLGRLLRPVVFPRFKCPGCRFTWSPGLFLLELLPPSRSGCGSYRCPSCSSHPSPAWFSSKTSASWVSTEASAPDSEQAFTFGSFSLLSIQLGLVSFYPSGKLVRRLGSLPPIFPFSFSFRVLITPGLMDRELEGIFPSGCSSFRFGVALPPH